MPIVPKRKITRKKQYWSTASWRSLFHGANRIKMYQNYAQISHIGKQLNFCHEIVLDWRHGCMHEYFFHEKKITWSSMYQYYLFIYLLISFVLFSSTVFKHSWIRIYLLGKQNELRLYIKFCFIFFAKKCNQKFMLITRQTYLPMD